MAAFKDPYADDIPGGGGFKDPYAEDLKPNAAQDFVKQFGSGLVTGTEGIAAFPARAAGFVGGLVEKIPGLAPREEQATQRQQLLDVIEKQRGGGIAKYLPQPETTAGQFGRTIGETIPGFVAGTRGPVLGAVAGTAIPQALIERAAPAALTRGAGVSVPQALAAGATAGAASELAGQATEGTAAEPYARVGASLAGGAVALRQAEAAAARRAVPTIENTEARAGQLYDQFRGSGLNYNPTISPQFSQSIKTELQGRGLTDSNAVAGATWGALTRALEDNVARTPQDFHSLYQELGHIAQGAGANAGQRLSANIAQERLLQFMEHTPQGALTGNANAPAQAVGWLREANQDWAAAQRAKSVSQRIVRAEDKAGANYSGLNLENELRRRIGAMANPEIARRAGFSPGEEAAIRRFDRGTFGPNALRYVGNALAGGGGSVGIGAAGLVGGGAGGAYGYLSGGDPVMGAIIGSGAPLAGLGLRLGSNRWALARAQQVENMLRSRSPLAAQTMGNYSQPAAPFAGAALSAPLQLTVRPGDRTLSDLGD